ncbi:methyltransferase domain-containing protein [Glaciecola sp. SC05]|uniref:methyltransferase domain-containing protein n=1 Tax=Glaciecola sp. SC05 TaxID=1987355 RepID=UPI0035282405
MKSGSFDGIANKFDKNIYGTTKGRLRHALLTHYLVDCLDAETPLSVLDAGGGTGMMSYEFASRGHRVDILDVSSETLDIAKQRLIDFPETNYICGDIGSVERQYDLIICHALLEWLDDPILALDKLIHMLRPEGVLSLSFFNQDAMLFNNAIYGNFDYIAKGMKVRNVVRLNPHNPQSPAKVIAKLEASDHIDIEFKAGIRCFHDYMRDTTMQSTHFDNILMLEKQYGATAPYMWLGKYFYIRLKKASA